jgi:hypothetical protein
MAQNFIDCDRDRVLLMAPSLREWLLEGHLAWFVLAAVEEISSFGISGSESSAVMAGAGALARRVWRLGV